MDSCTKGPRYCPTCGKELDFSAKICKFCSKVVDETPKISFKIFSKRPRTYTLIGVLLIISSYILGGFYPNNCLFYSFYLFSSYYTSYIPLVIFVIGFSFVYFSNDLKLRGLIQIGVGTFATSLSLLSNPLYCFYSGDCLRIFSFILGFNFPAIIMIFFGILTLNNAPIVHFFGFFLAIFYIVRIHNLIIIR